MEDQVVVEALGGELAEVLDRLRGIVVVELEFDRTGSWCAWWRVTWPEHGGHSTPGGRDFSARAHVATFGVTVSLDAQTSSARGAAARRRRLGVPALFAALVPPAARPGRPPVPPRRSRRESQAAEHRVIVPTTRPRSTMSPEVMPNLYSKLMAHGTSFSDYVVTTPLCCPSRAAYHDRPVRPQQRRPSQLLPRPPRQAERCSPRGCSGAATRPPTSASSSTATSCRALAGGGRPGLGPLDGPSSRSASTTTGRPPRTAGCSASGPTTTNNATTVTSRYATTWTTKLAAEDRPFYLQVDYFAPHTGAGPRHSTCAAAPKPEPRTSAASPTLPLPQPPSFNQDDVTEMPSFIRDRPLLTDEEIAKVTQHYRCTLESLYGVDRGIGQIYDAIGSAGELNRTSSSSRPITATSTASTGSTRESRSPTRRTSRAADDQRAAALSRPIVRSSPTSDAPVANIDLAPTLLHLADADAVPRGTGNCRTMDGRSLMPRSRGRGVPGAPRDRPRAIELRLPRRPLRTGSIYISYSSVGTTGCRPAESELYDHGYGPLPAPRPRADHRGHAERRAAPQAGAEDATARDMPGHPPPRPATAPAASTTASSRNRRGFDPRWLGCHGLGRGRTDSVAGVRVSARGPRSPWRPSR